MDEEECYYAEERCEMAYDMMDEEEEKCDMANIMSIESVCMAMAPQMESANIMSMEKECMPPPMARSMAPQMEFASFEAHDMEGSASTTKPKFG